MFRNKLRACLVVLVWAGAAGCSRAESGDGGKSSPEPPEASPNGAAIAPRIRRLTNAEYDATVHSLLGTEQTLGAQFVPDARLHPHGQFDRNEAQVVEPMLARQLQQAATSLAKEYVDTRLELQWACARQGDADCANLFFESLLPRAYRREVSASELSDLMAMVVTPALQRVGFQAAVALGIEAILQSAAFLYHSELGPSDAGSGVVTLTDEEIAQSLAYLVTGAPADAELSGAADLNRPALREAHARRLLETPEARAQLGQMVKQWLAIDHAGDLIKDEVQFPEFRPLMFDAESDAFIEEVVFNQGGGFQLLLGADFSVGPVELAEFYGATATSSEPGLISLAGVPRRGILNRGAFLTSYPSPTQRGVQVLTQTLCIDPGDPAALMVDMTLPPAGPSQTRRERFEQHSQAQCAGCHDMIDNIGFAFEHFDEIGSWVENEAGDPERPIDSVTTLALPSQVGFGSEQVADSNELAELISTSEVGARCLARNLARFTAASHGEALEQRFLEEWEALQRAGQAGLEELLVAYVRSRPFIERAEPSAEGEP